MATTYTSRLALQKPAAGDTGWSAPLLANIDALDAIATLGPLAVTPAENPSASLNVKVAAGTFRDSAGDYIDYAGTASQAMTASQTNYVYLTDGGTLTVNTTGFPAATNLVRLAVVTTGGTTVTAISDRRVVFQSFGA